MRLARPCLLALVALLAVGCGSTQRHRIAPGEQTAALGGVGLQAEVTEIANNERKLVVYLTLSNEGDEELRFKKAGVSMEIEGRPYAAHDIGFRNRELDIDLVPGQVKEKSWAFETHRLTAPGTYELTITGIGTWDGSHHPIGDDLVLPVTVPKSKAR